MAETLSVTDMLPNKFEPKRKNRWVFAIEGIDAYLIKSTKRPSVKTEEKEIPWINSRRYIAGKTTFDTIEVSLYDAIAPSGSGRHRHRALGHQGLVHHLSELR